MKTLINFSAVTLLLITAFINNQFAQSNEINTSANFEVKELAEDVYGIIRKDPPGLMCDGNSGFIITEEYVVVIDAPEASAEIIKAIKQISEKPVKYVINTHWHDDHITGNKLYRDAYPGVEFIGHTSLRDYLPEQGLNNRKSMIEGAPGGLDYLKGLLASNKGTDGTEITEEERAAFASDIALVEHYLSFVPDVEIILPTITFENKLTISNSNHTIEILNIGSGHTMGDIVVHLPKENILFSGDLIVFPIPLVGGEQSHVSEWSNALENLIVLKPMKIIPGHGPVLNDLSYVKKLIELYTSVTDQVRIVIETGKTLEETRGLINLDKQRKIFAGHSKLKNFLFSMYVEGPAVTAAFRELSIKK
ncbi:MAG: MBL fold metallo-hydrolase [bacterium]